MAPSFSTTQSTQTDRRTTAVACDCGLYGKPAWHRSLVGIGYLSRALIFFFPLYTHARKMRDNELCTCLSSVTWGDCFFSQQTNYVNGKEKDAIRPSFVAIHSPRRVALCFTSARVHCHVLCVMGNFGGDQESHLTTPHHMERRKKKERCISATEFEVPRKRQFLPTSENTIL